MLDSQATSAAIYKQLFTDSEWDAISSALNDYSDYGNEEAMIADSIQAKISAIFRLTSNWIMNTKVAKHLSIPENRINYSFHFLDNFSYEFVDYKKCYDAIAKWSDNLDTSESHYWWNTHLLSFKDDGWKSLTDYHLQLNGLLSSTKQTSNELHSQRTATAS